MRRLHSWLKKTPVNPYWLEMRHLDSAVRHLTGHASGVMLDVGVGERPYGSLFSPHVKRYFGLEYPPVVFGNLNPDLWDYIHVVHGIIDIFGDAHVLPVADASVDTILSLEVLEHVPDPDRCVAEMARALRPGGKLLITVPFVSPLHQLPYDFRRFTPAGLEELLSRYGLEIEELRSRGNVASAAGSMLAHYLLRHWAAKARKHDGSVIMSPLAGPPHHALHCHHPGFLLPRREVRPRRRALSRLFGRCPKKCRAKFMTKAFLLAMLLMTLIRCGQDPLAFAIETDSGGL